MNIQVLHHSTKPATIEKRFPGAQIVDVTSKGPQPWVKFSPFYPHGNIPVPFCPGRTAQSVEGIWQGLKVFAEHDTDEKVLDNATMRGLKRTERRFGRTLGHRKGLKDGELLSYVEARKVIYLPSYLWVLQNCLQPELDQLRGLEAQGPLILLDYETNTDPENPSKPLAHAALIRVYLMDEWPE